MTTRHIPLELDKDGKVTLENELRIELGARHEEIKRLRAALEIARCALNYIDHELGRPEGLKIPAPVVNASFKCRDALTQIDKALHGGKG